MDQDSCIVCLSYQYSDGGHEMGAGEEDGPVDVADVALVALGASADVADVVISVSIFSHLFIFSRNLHLSDEDYQKSIILHCWISVNMTCCEEQRLMFVVWRRQRKVPTVVTEKTQPSPASAINVSKVNPSVCCKSP